MQTIRYIFSDGTASEIEVTDEFYTLYAEPVQQEKRNHWKEKRGRTKIEHIALSALSDEKKRLAKRCFATGRAKSRETKKSGRGKCAEKLI